MKPKLSYKIKIYYRVYAFVALGFTTQGLAQDPVVVRKENQYGHIVKEDSLKKMIELRSLVPTVIYDLRYATEKNFTGKQLYRTAAYTFLRMPAAEAIKKIQEELARKNLGLKIFDAYRPYSVTKKMWEIVHDERYVANPLKGSGHNRGLSIDLTLVNLATGKDLDMGTDFDNFSDSAGHAFTNFPAEIIQNRQLLRETMEKFGFKPLPTEWWHYSWPNDRNYELLDLPFKKLRRERD